MPASARLINRWWQLLACMIAMVAIANLQYTWTLFTVPLSAGLRAKLSEVQLAFTLFILTQAGWYPRRDTSWIAWGPGSSSRWAACWSV